MCLASLGLGKPNLWTVWALLLRTSYSVTDCQPYSELGYSDIHNYINGSLVRYFGPSPGIEIVHFRMSHEQSSIAR
jgi:hypothetical protein